MPPHDPIPSWAREAAAWPLAFAQVREDAELDLAIADRLPRDASVAMVASGGCTAAALARHPRIGRLTLVDPNPAQLALTRLKLRLLEATPGERLRILGHRPMEPADRLRALERFGAAVHELGSPDRIAARGPDHAGRYERTFEALREALAPRRRDLLDLLSLESPREQAKRLEGELGAAVDAAFRLVMSHEILVHLFGTGATGHRRREFAEHFIERTRRTLAALPARGNPYLAQVLAGEFLDGSVSPWLSLPPGPGSARIQEHRGTLQDALQASRDEFDFIHASNILDWLDEGAARRLLEVATRALKPGGWILVRQLNSTLDIRALGDRVAWDPALSAELLDRDRSWFYVALHAGVRA